MDSDVKEVFEALGKVSTALRELTSALIPTGNDGYVIRLLDEADSVIYKALYGDGE